MSSVTLRAVLLDLDDTLLPEGEPLREAFFATGRRAHERHGIDPGRLHEAVRRRAREQWQQGAHFELCRALGVSSTEGLAGDFALCHPDLKGLAKFTPGYRRAVWTLALADLGVEDPTLAEELAAAFPEERVRTLGPRPASRGVLETLVASYSLVLVTNGPSNVQRSKIAAAGFTPYFASILISGELGVGKPDPRIFCAALDAASCAPAEAVMVGNSLKRDIRGARDAGIRTIWVAPPDADSEDASPDARLADVAELPELLAAW